MALLRDLVVTEDILTIPQDMAAAAELRSLEMGQAAAINTTDIRVRHMEQVAAAALRFRSILQEALPGSGLTVRVLGPAPASVAKVSNHYRYRLTLSLQNSREARQLLSWLLRRFSKDKENRGVNAFADINPYE